MWRSEGEVMLDKVTGKEQGIVFDLERGYRDGGRHVAWATQCHSRGVRKRKREVTCLSTKKTHFSYPGSREL